MLGQLRRARRWLEREAAAHSIKYDAWFRTRREFVSPTPLSAKWNLIGVRIKEKLLIPTGNFLLTLRHRSAGKGETKAEFIHRREHQSEKHQGNGSKLQKWL